MLKIGLKKFILGIFLIVTFLIFNFSSSCGAEELIAVPDFPPPVSAPPVNELPGFGTPPSSRLKLMTFNVHHGTDMNGFFNLEAVVETIRQSGADIIALQEVDRVWGGRSLYYNEARFIAEELFMNYAFGATISQNSFLPGRGEFGMMVLSKYPILSNSFRLLPSIMEQRGILLCLIQTPGRVIPVACTHLGLSALDWESQITDILNWLPLQDDVILLGDFNAVVGPNELIRFEGRFTDLQRECGLSESGTFLMGENWVRIDYVFAGNRWRPANCQVINSQSSDHLPVYVEIEPAINDQELSLLTPLLL
ncbi:MAG TPA: endonuclease/exonuclease/phosphatase family protein [Bacillota bacterium]|nr:endonuclease/exonuclease/phosphatase family protein [Bacillota bacterium]